MSLTRLYSAAPIVEAAAEVRFSAPIKPRTIQRYVSAAKGYPEKLRQQIRRVQVNISSDEASMVNGGEQYRLSNEDQTESLIINAHSVVIAQTAPYRSWEEFGGRIARGLRQLEKVIGTRKVERIGLRYINRIDFPGDRSIIPNEYLKLGWVAPSQFGTPRITSLQAEFTIEDPKCKLVLKAGSAESEVPNLAAAILDIDLIVDDQPPTTVEDIIAKFNDLRVKKNQIFEDCITDAARKRFG